ncbi:hypothetical protein GCM10027019_17020 [Melaminivora jejuensis]
MRFRFGFRLCFRFGFRFGFWDWLRLRLQLGFWDWLGQGFRLRFRLRLRLRFRLGPEPRRWRRLPCRLVFGQQKGWGHRRRRGWRQAWRRFGGWCRCRHADLQVLGGVEHLLAVPAAHPAATDAQLIRDHAKGGGAVRAAGGLAHEAAILGGAPAADADAQGRCATIRIQPSSLSATASCSQGA